MQLHQDIAAIQTIVDDAKERIAKCKPRNKQRIIEAAEKKIKKIYKDGVHEMYKESVQKRSLLPISRKQYTYKKHYGPKVKQHNLSAKLKAAVDIALETLKQLG